MKHRNRKPFKCFKIRKEEEEELESKMGVHKSKFIIDYE